MYAFISGIIDFIDPNGLVVVDNNGIGYNINVSLNTLSELPKKGEKTKIYTYTLVKEDSFSLFGFASHNEKNMFIKLIGINGVGPKVALSILSGITATQLAIAVANSDVKSLSTIKGIGKKTAERIILELKEKVDITAEDIAGNVVAPVNFGLTKEMNDAIEALVALGITKNDAYKAVQKASENAKDTNALITLALRGMAK